MIGAKFDALKPREKVGLLIALCVLFVVIVDRVIVSPLLRHCDDMQASITLAEMELAHQRLVLASGPEIEQSYRAVEDLIGPAGSDTETVDAMKGELDNLARAAGLEIVSMQHRDPEKRVYVQEFIVDIGKFEGSMPALLQFLHDLWNAPGLLRVRSINAGLSRDGSKIEGAVRVTKAGMIDLQ